MESKAFNFYKRADFIQKVLIIIVKIFIIKNFRVQAWMGKFIPDIGRSITFQTSSSTWHFLFQKWEYSF